MSNGIDVRQNLPENLQLLAAQRIFYTRAKRVAAIQAWTVAITPILSAGVTAFHPKATSWAALFGVGAVLADTIWLDPTQEEWRKCGATTQEIFDCSVFELGRNEALEGSYPTVEEIFEASKEYHSNDTASLVDWYPKEAGEVSLNQGRIICQRANVWWDSKLRSRYRACIVIALIAISTASFCVGFAQHWTMEQFLLANVIPLLPTFQWAGREWKRQTQAAAELIRLREDAEQILTQMLTGSLSNDELDLRCRLLQDAILVGRRQRATVFDWVYRRLRRTQEEQMNVGAQQLVSRIHEQSVHGSNSKLLDE